MTTKTHAFLATAMFGLMTLVLTGCGGPNLISRISNFWTAGCCGIVVIILDVIALLEIAGSSRSTGDKVLWALLIIFFPVLGFIAYYFFARRR